MVKYYWMAVTPDKYELPLAVEPTFKALAKVLGKTPNSIAKNENQKLSGKIIGYRIVKVRRV